LCVYERRCGHDVVRGTLGALEGDVVPCDIQTKEKKKGQYKVRDEFPKQENRNSKPKKIVP